MCEVDTSQEIWRTVEWAPMYSISNLGRLKSFYKDKVNGKIRKVSPRKDEYYRLTLTLEDGTKRITSLHQLVAQAFVPNPENKPHVNHIDEDKSNNRWDNLEWVTPEENNNHGTHNERVRKSRGRKIRCLETGIVYYSTGDVLRKTGMPLRILRKEKMKKEKGFTWMWEDEYQKEFNS